MTKKFLLWLIVTLVFVNIALAEEFSLSAGEVKEFNAEQGFTSVSIKDIILDSKANLVRGYNEYTFNVDPKGLTKINGNPILHLDMTTEPIIITSDKVLIGDKEINVLADIPIISPKLVYNLSRNIRIIQNKNENALFLDDNKVNFTITKAKVINGTLSLNEEEILIKLMPFQTKNELRIMLESPDYLDKQIDFKEITFNTKKKQASYIFNTMVKAKLLFYWEIEVPLELKVNSFTGNLKVSKPWYSFLVFGEERNLDDITKEIN